MHMLIIIARLISAGGIISLGLGPTELDVDECDKKFVEFAKQAFSPHRLAKAPWLSRWLRYIVTAFYQGQYKTEPLEKAIKDAFPEDCPLFGGTYQSRRVPVKVAVTTTTRQSQVVVLSNYNRKPPKTCEQCPIYIFPKIRHANTASSLVSFPPTRAR